MRLGTRTRARARAGLATVKWKSMKMIALLVSMTLVTTMSAFGSFLLLITRSDVLPWW